MKVLAGLVLVAIIALAQGRTYDTQITRNDDVFEAAWVVLLTIVEGNGGFGYCIGTMVSQQHVLTDNACTLDARFTWQRYGAERVANPELVLEGSSYTRNAPLAILNTNRIIHLTPKIQVIGIEDGVQAFVPEEDHPLFDYGFNEFGALNEERRRSYVTPVSPDLCDGDLCAHGEVVCSTNLGTPLVSGGRLVGVAFSINPNCGAGKSTDNALAFTRVGNHANWIRSIIGPSSDFINDEPVETVQVAETADIIEIVDADTVYFAEAVQVAYM